eukprot:TRINITY_DN14130_c0_g1_i1.p1 TRINITY_DN14130_c0_g1~~TRINITY_DN14130_c0_g1_i1.p1  ORF type:complete len:666 (-),score=114.44 TRINITY_DN14130_c0_g1_i1:45-1943(-)
MTANELVVQVAGLLYSCAVMVFIIIQAIIIYKEVVQHLRKTSLAALKDVVSNLLGAVMLQSWSIQPLDRRIHAIVQERIAARIRSAAVIVSHVVLIWLVMTANTVARNSGPWFKGSELLCLRQLLTLPGNIWIVIMAPVAQVWTARPRWVGPSSSYVIWVAHCVFDCGSAFLHISTEHLISARLTRIAFRFVLAVFLGNAPMATVVNILISVFSVIAHIRLNCKANVNCTATRSWDVPSCPAGTAFGEFVNNEFIASVCIIFSAWLLEHRTRREAKATLEASVSAQAEVGIEQLLSAMSDAVLRLDNKLRIMNGSPQLAGLLFRGGGRNMLEGCSFIDLVAEEDRERVIHCLAPCTVQDMISSGCDCQAQAQAEEEQIHVAPTLHMSLLDGHNGPVPVQMFFVPFRNVVFEHCYLLGIRELLDFERLPPAPSEGDVNNALAGPHTIFYESIRAVDSDVPSLLSGDIERMLSEGICIWFFAASFQILRASPGFSALCGPSSVEVPFVRWVPVDQMKRFKEFVQTVVNKEYNAEEDSEEESSGPVRGTIQFQPPGMHSSVVYDSTFTMEMDTQALLENETNKSDEDDMWVIRMTLDNVRRHRGGGSSSKGAQAKKERRERQLCVTTLGRPRMHL